MNDPMTLERFAALLESYGAEERRWPDAERAPAAALLAASPAARTLRDEARRLDELLDESVVDDPVPALRAAILATVPAPPAQPQRRVRAGHVRTRWWTALWADMGGWRPAGALAAALVLGLFSGGALLGSPADEFGADIAQLALFDNNFTGY
jgi:hypothetical protein